MRADLVVVFARAPVVGTVKTRLAASIGDEAACEVYQWLGARVVEGLAGDSSRSWDVCVRYTPRDGEGLVRAWVGCADEYAPQGEGDLGARMQEAVEAGLARGYRAVVLVGTDCVAVTPERVREALDALDALDVVMGPACDGGYYLLGLRRLFPVFEGVAWSTESVADTTRARVGGAGGAMGELPVERDVDTVDDLIALTSSVVAAPRH